MKLSHAGHDKCLLSSEHLYAFEQSLLVCRPGILSIVGRTAALLNLRSDKVAQTSHSHG